MQINHCLQININILDRKSRILNLQGIFIILTKKFFYAGLLKKHTNLCYTQMVIHCQVSKT